VHCGQFKINYDYKFTMHKATVIHPEVETEPLKTEFVKQKTIDDSNSKDIVIALKECTYTAAARY